MSIHLVSIDGPVVNLGHKFGHDGICTTCWTHKGHADATKRCRQRSGVCLNCTARLKPEDYGQPACPYCGVS